MKRIVDISDDTFNMLKDIVETDCVDPYSLADIIVNKSIPLQECEFLSTLMQSVMTTEQLKEVFQKMVEEKNRWIPVSERLPDLFEVVLVTDESGKVFEYERRSLDDDGNVCREWSFLGRSIIAWMPLPEPYKKGGAE